MPRDKIKPGETICPIDGLPCFKSKQNNILDGLERVMFRTIIVVVGLLFAMLLFAMYRNVV